MKVIKDFDLDGVDLDWEYPVIQGGNKEKVQFIQLLYEIKVEFNRHSKTYLLTAAVAAAESIVQAAYYVQHIAELRFSFIWAGHGDGNPRAFCTVTTCVVI